MGGGGHCRVVLDSIQRLGDVIPAAIIDANEAAWGQSIQGVIIRGGDDQLPILKAEGVTHFVVAIGGGGEGAPRVRIYERGVDAGLSPCTVIHPSSICSSWARIGEGTVVLPAAVVNAGAVLGVNVIVNSSAVVEHDCEVGDHVHIATGAKVCGGAKIGKSAFVGAGAVIRQGITVGAGAIVGAGSVVVHDVLPQAVVKGVPAK